MPDRSFCCAPARRVWGDFLIKQRKYRESDARAAVEAAEMDLLTVSLDYRSVLRFDGGARGSG